MRRHLQEQPLQGVALLDLLGARDPDQPPPVEEPHAVAAGLGLPKLVRAEQDGVLATERPEDAPQNLGGATSGTGGIVPDIIAIEPANVGNIDFKIGVARALGGSTAWVAISQSPPIDGVVPPDILDGPIDIPGDVPGSGYATYHWPIPADASLEAEIYYMQWRIDDPQGNGGIAF